MFGYIQANLKDLSEEEKNRYKAAYCGLCHALGERYGGTAKLGLSYDLTFIALLLSSLYEPEEKTGRKRCLLHPAKKHDYMINKYTEYAADMSVILNYYNCLDDWNDDKKVTRKCYANVLEPKYKEAKKRWPDECNQIENAINSLSEIENKNFEGKLSGTSKDIEINKLIEDFKNVKNIIYNMYNMRRGK